MDDSKLVTINDKELKVLIQTIEIYSLDIGMEFGIEKCAISTIKSEERRNRTDKSRKTHKAWIKGNYKYLRILEADTIKQAGMKENNKKRVLQMKETVSWDQTLQQ